MEIEFAGDIWHWRGPAPFYFVTVPEVHCAALREIAGSVTYGWGMIPARLRVGATEWTTSLFPKNGGYIVPLKDRVRAAENLDEGDRITVRLSVG
jgi:hypothetical protein